MNMLTEMKKSVSVFINAFSATVVMSSIRQGLTLMIPVMMIGAFALFLNNVPVAAYQGFMKKLFGISWEYFGLYIHRGTFSIMSAGMLLTISYSMSRNSPRGLANKVNPMIAVIVALGSFFTVMRVENDLFRFSWLGPLGVFTAIIIACLSTMLFLYFSSIPWMKLRMYSNAADQNLTQSITSLIPAFMTISVFALIHLFMTEMGIDDMNEAMNLGLKSLFTGMSSSLMTALIFISLIHLFWFFGIHGNNVLEPVTQNLFVPALAVNQKLIAQGLPPTEIFTKQFFDVFVLLGGSGATLCLIVAIIISTRRSNTKQIAGISVLPSIINVNEIMIFGIPVILNFYLIIPFIFLPVLLTVISYAAMSAGLVNLTAVSVEWTTPILIGGYKTTGSVSGLLLQLFNLIAGIAFYWPFIRLHEKSLARGQVELLETLNSEVTRLEEMKETILLTRSDSIGNLARLLSSDLERDLRGGKLSILYQPQVNSENRMTGMEALLRWEHDEFGFISPPVIIALAEETPIMNELGIWIFRSACNQMKTWKKAGMKDLTLSINLSPHQLDDQSMPSKVRSILNDTNISPASIEIEITEQAALGGLKRLKRLDELKSMGLRLAMDDFGMGHSSLMYLKELSLDTIKLDGALIHEVLVNEKCKEIISSIVQLGKSMNISIIAEYVDSEPQQKELLRLGCMVYQGYLYSPPLKPDELLLYYFKLADSP